MGSKQYEFSVEPVRAGDTENVVLWLAEDCPEARDRRVAEAVWAYLQERDGHAILAAKPTAEKLRSWGIDAVVDENARQLTLRRSIRIPIYTATEYVAKNQSENGPMVCLRPTDDLVLDEIELVRSLYRYCFGGTLDVTDADMKSIDSTWRRCRNRFRDALDNIPHYGIGVNIDGGQGTDRQRYKEIPKDVFDKFLASGLFPRVQ